MIRKYKFGSPFETGAVAAPMEAERGMPPYGEIWCGDEVPACGEKRSEEGVPACGEKRPVGPFSYRYVLHDEDIVYGLGEANRGINKRGYQYVSDCTDQPNHTEDKRSLYGSHNFIVISGKETFGLFFDYPSRMTFDIGYEKTELMTVSCERADLYLYVIEGDSAYDVVKQFRKIIGRSYIPPKFAFGFGQSRWGYRTKEDFRHVADGYRSNRIPLDMIYMDIDYMQDYKDFTVNEEEYPDFPAFVAEMKERGIRLIPIIDAGVKVEEGYPVYEEGVREGYFCKREDGSEFTAVVWPGETHFPDFLNEKAARWFGDLYRGLTDQGIEGFWNDMNEPAIFYSQEGVRELQQVISSCQEMEHGMEDVRRIQEKAGSLANAGADYKRFYHAVNGQMIRHDQVHNLYGYHMTKAAAEAFGRIAPNRRLLLFSRASYIGMHRYGGIWTGDNHSWWSHLLLNLKMLPSLNMCGFLYVGADLGGFGADTTRELLLRWLALGVFTPLMRDHAALGTRDQEAYRFGDTEAFRGIIETRYRLLPYLYSEYLKAAYTDDMYCRPLAFVYPEDDFARGVEDQLIIGDEIMIAPVCTEHARGRYVYLPEEMRFVKMKKDNYYIEETLEPGHHYVEVAVDEVSLFIRAGKCIPLVDAAQCVEEIDMQTMKLIGYGGASYERYDDDGVHADSRVRRTVESM